MGRLVSVQEVAELTSIAESTLYSWRARQIGPQSFRLNGRVVYDADAVTAWVEAQRAATTRGDAFMSVVTPSTAVPPPGGPPGRHGSTRKAQQ